jgi:Skp family chaperone for outer membrane proteins
MEVPMTRVLLLFVCLTAMAANPALAQSLNASARFAFFSPSRAFAESSDGKAATARLSALEADRAKAAQEKEAALRKLEQSLEQTTAVLSDAARGQRTKELEKFRLDTQRFIEDAQAELMGVRRDAESAFLVKLRPAIERVVKDNGIELLFNFDSGVLAWGDPSLDVTSQIVKHVENPAATK